MFKLEWSRRNFLKAMGVWAGAGLVQPLLPLLAAGKSIEGAYPEELLSIEKFTKGKVKPGMIISKDNADLIKDFAPEALYIELTRGREIKIAETNVDPADWIPAHWLEASLRNKGQAKLDSKGQLYTLKGEPWIGGDAFLEPKNALEALWNFYFCFPRYDDFQGHFSEHDIDSHGNEVRSREAIYAYVQTVGRLSVDPKPYIPDHKDELYRNSLGFISPVDSYGINVLTIVSYDQTQLPTTDAYIPSLRRVRTIPSSQRFEPVAPYATEYATDVDIINDPLLTWSWSLVGRKPMLQPSNTNVGTFSASKGKDPKEFTMPFVQTKFPRSTWELRPEVLLIDGIPHLEGANYSKKRVYIDAVSRRASVAECWDLAGKIWRWYAIPYSKVSVHPERFTFPALFFADVQADYRTNIWILSGYDKYNAGLKIADRLTPAALLNLARR